MVLRIFDKKKTYELFVLRGTETLTFRATNVEVIGELVSFVDKFGQRMVFPVSSIQQAKEAVR